MNIGFDLDGVLTNLGDFILNYGSKFMIENGRKIGKINPEGYDIAQVFGWDADFTWEYWKKYRPIYSTKEPPRAFAGEVLRKLKADGHRIHIITARSSEYSDPEFRETMQKWALQWFDDNNLFYDDITFTTVDKLQDCRDKNIDVMVEDSPHNIMQLSEFIPIIVYNTRYNKECEGKNITRCYSLYDVYEKITEMANSKK